MVRVLVVKPFASPNEQSQNSASLQTTRQTQATDKQSEVESSDGRMTVEQLYGHTTNLTLLEKPRVK